MKLPDNYHSNNVYYGTLTWYDFTKQKDYSKTIRRNTYKDLLADIKEYLMLYDARSPKIDTCAIEEKVDKDISSWVDITEKVQKELN